MNLAAAFASARQQQRDGNFAEAESEYRQILAVDPNQADVHYNLGLVLRDRGRLDEAVAAYQQALDLQPRFPEAANNLGTVYESMGRLDEAEDMFRHALLLQPASADTWSNLGGVLKDLGRIDEAIACLERAVQLEPGNARIHSNLVFTLHYSPAWDAPALLNAARTWNDRHAQAHAGNQGTRPHENIPAPQRRLRIGYLSPYFREHCQALFTVPLLSHHDHTAFEIFCYADGSVSDDVTSRLRTHADTWRPIQNLTDAEVAASIERDQIDVLVDLTLHMARHRLAVFARRPAPVQLTWLGYPGTTGLAAMDYRLTDPELDPAATNDAFYAERSIRLPDSFWCYDPLTAQPLVNELPASHSGRVAFGCLNNFCKVNAGVMAMWSRVLAAVPDSTLTLLAPPGASRRRVKAALGVSPDRIKFVGYQPRPDYLKVYCEIDLGLDTFPYNGHTTSLDSLWMGVPVVSLRGQTAVSRAGSSLLKNLGLSELVAETPDQFVRIAVELAQAPERLAELRGSLRERMTHSPLMNAGRFARNIEHAYRVAWVNWRAAQISAVDRGPPPR